MKFYSTKSNLRYTQIAVASFGPMIRCGQSPAGFARLTPEVLRWVKATAKMDRPEGKTTNATLQESRSFSVVVKDAFTNHNVLAHYCLVWILTKNITCRN